MSEPVVGKVKVRKRPTGGRRRHYGRDTAYSLHCDAAAIDSGKRVLILSAAGDESVVKGMLAALRSEDHTVEFDLDVPSEKKGECGLTRYGCERHPAGYKVYRTRLADVGLWHVLCVAKVVGLMPVANEEALWQQLRSGRYTTPVLRVWVPWLMGQLKKRSGGLANIDQAGCEAGWLQAGEELIDELVSEGLASGALKIEEVGVAG